ncbi:MAG: SipW-dependent-type signal peptide-containing protein [Patescibacteria group bacterium]|nr:SipW-dependent-type signal peptide-containing protein [Patescibacteria group bacterium]
MRRILLATVIATASLSVAVMTTWAAWTSSVTVSNNVITTGSVSLQVSLTGNSNDYGSSVSSSTAISGLMPTNTSSKGTTFYVKNNSSTGVNFNLGAVGSAVISGSPAPADLTSLQISIVPSGSSASTIDANYHTLSAWGSSQTLGTLSSGASQPYDIYAKLATTAADDWQGRQVTFAVTVTGSQI